MSQLTVFVSDNPAQPLLHTSDSSEIQRQLNNAGVRFEQWQASATINADSSAEQIQAAYAADIAKLQAEGGYVTVDVISLSSHHPDKVALRQKFLAEHTHSEDEVRFFVRGQGLFCLHINGKVYQVLCQQNDLISVPAGTTHWFDMGSEPEFTAIRLFNNPQGWVANFTGSDIAGRFPLLP
ncbi:MAG: acireductone dioxygenase [Gammaproteobacteria bacterium]|nr:acireductone dioxygenase [Gammaproteobacteria bacterium]MBU1553266.1 acireductone dioxygenase [Gammaproteobacteria bacterium]MBU2070886.1 acireductone dioxygenase [Gammaproteobacteria bacterium]MBU2185021.1 acireductone dioxygenase [Gammaproteobacteria bacterium]MBU2204092.1 acireductone dioxygenase [Gammaproteobacteria bacterium]